jgi:alpha,alpha-trehalase
MSSSPTFPLTPTGDKSRALPTGLETAHAGSGAEARKAKLLSLLDQVRPLIVKPANGSIQHPYCIPGGYYEHQWDWDGFFIACHLAARSEPLPTYLKYWALNVLSSALPDGDVAACMSPSGPRNAHPSLRLKPFLAQGAELAGRLLGDDSWIAGHYSEIVRMATRREATHFNHHYGLFVWQDAMESGIDNNAAVGNEPTAEKSIASCDINTYYHREYLALHHLAKRLGHVSDALVFQLRAQRLLAAMTEHLWDAEDQSFWNLDLRSGTWIKRVSCSNFIPLWAALANPEGGREMIKRYLWNEHHLLGPFGLRSLSISDPAYNNANTINPYSNWQGPVWPIANYFYFVALINYGFREEAAKLVDRLTRLYLKDFEFCDSLHENYHAETGSPLAPSADQSKEGREGGFFGWNLLLVDMIEMLEGKPNLLEFPPN